MTYTTKKVIDAYLERQVRALGNECGFTDTPLKSQGTHQIELQFNRDGRTEYAYISRTVGISKDQFQIVLRPEVSEKLKDALAGISEVTQKMNAKNKTNPEIQSSQYKGFKNKKSSGGEHRGHAYRLPSDDGLKSLEQLFNVLTA